MNESASSSTSLITDVPAFEQGGGHTVQFAMADLLAKGQFAAQTIVPIDSGFARAVYGRHAEKHNRPPTLHLLNEKLFQRHQLDSRASVRSCQSKADLIKIFVEPFETPGVRQTMAEAFTERFSKIAQTQSGAEALAW